MSQKGGGMEEKKEKKKKSGEIGIMSFVFFYKNPLFLWIFGSSVSS